MANKRPPRTGENSPGAYRVDARLDGAPWLFTNHINVGMPLVT